MGTNLVSVHLSDPNTPLSIEGVTTTGYLQVSPNGSVSVTPTASVLTNTTPILTTNSLDAVAPTLSNITTGASSLGTLGGLTIKKNLVVGHNTNTPHWPATLMSNTAMIVGGVSSAGVATGSGFTSSFNSSTKIYTINFTESFNGAPFTIVTPIESNPGPYMPTITSTTPSMVSIRLQATVSGVLTPGAVDFYFVCVGPRL